MQPRPKKALGQHWLDDEASLGAMVSLARISAADNVLEIGPGPGLLTDKLLTSGATITALEYDKYWAGALQQKYTDSNSVIVTQGDIRTYDLGSLPANYKIVANIPYYLTANLLRKLVDDSNKPTVATLLIQKEVAERVASKPGDLSLIAVLVQLFYETDVGPVIPAHLFDPPPKVDSQILILTRRPRPLYEPSETLYRVIKAGFSEKRKKIKAGLAGGLGISKDAASDMLARAHVDENKRPQELTHGDWHRLSLVLDSPAL